MFSIGEEQTPYVNGMFRPIAYRLDVATDPPVAGHANEKVKSVCAGFCFLAGFLRSGKTISFRVRVNSKLARGLDVP